MQLATVRDHSRTFRSCFFLTVYAVLLCFPCRLPRLSLCSLHTRLCPRFSMTTSACVALLSLTPIWPQVSRPPLYSPNAQHVTNLCVATLSWHRSSYAVLLSINLPFFKKLSQHCQSGATAPVTRAPPCSTVSMLHRPSRKSKTNHKRHKPTLSTQGVVLKHHDPALAQRDAHIAA